MFWIILKDLRVAPLRTFLTSFSMFIGIIAMIAAFLVGTIGNDLLLSVNAQLAGFAPTYSLSISEFSIDEESGPRFLSVLADEPWAISLTPKENVKFSPMSNLSELENRRDRLSKNLKNYDTLFISDKYNQVYNMPLYQGRWFSVDNALDRFEIVMNKAAMEIFNQKYVVLSEARSLSLIPLNVIGVVNDGKDWPVLYINIQPLVSRTHIFEHSEAATIYWHTDSLISMERMQAIFEDKLYDTIGGKVENISRVDNAESYESVMRMLEIGLLISSGLLLFVSILGQINIGLASLEHRTHELLIRRALGASKWNIALQVLGAVMFLSIFVCLLALLLSVLLVHSLPIVLPPDSPITPPTYPYHVALIVITTSVMTALLGGLIPAIKASKLEPALALR